MWENGRGHGEVSVIWPDRTTLTIQWENDQPIEADRLHAMHPILKMKVDEEKCTAGFKEEKHAQPMWLCTWCKAVVCVTCWRHLEKEIGSQCAHEFLQIW